MAKKKNTEPKKVLCLRTCLARDMGLGYCVEGTVYTVPADVKVSKHFEELRPPVEEIKKPEEPEEKTEEEK